VILGVEILDVLGIAYLLLVDGTISIGGGVASYWHAFHCITLIDLLIYKGLALILSGVFLTGCLGFGFARFALYTFNFLFYFLVCWHWLLSLDIWVRQIDELLRYYVILNGRRHLVIVNGSSLVCRYWNKGD
jgi:hypothetical protein